MPPDLGQAEKTERRELGPRVFLGFIGFIGGLRVYVGLRKDGRDLGI